MIHSYMPVNSVVIKHQGVMEFISNCILLVTHAKSSIASSLEDQAQVCSST